MADVAAAYEGKAVQYFAEARSEMLAYVPTTAATILDVGCSTGVFGASLKKRQQCTVWGIEMVPAAAETARHVLDHVRVEAFDPAALPENHFDCLLFNDCLEHMPYPEKILVAAKRLLRSGGHVVASIPNMRYFPVMWDLIRHR